MLSLAIESISEARMAVIRKIDDELSIAGQITIQQLPQISRDGFKSILNLRSPDELSFLTNEQAYCKSLGLVYVNIPVLATTIEQAVNVELTEKLQAMPKPILVHCDTGERSAAVAFVHIAIRQGMSISEALRQAKQIGLFEIESSQKN
jgi:uncharacterized protein (TIGR01244 family)